MNYYIIDHGAGAKSQKDVKKHRGVYLLNMSELIGLASSSSQFDKSSKTYHFAWADHRGSISIGSRQAMLDGIPIPLSIEPIFKKKKMYAPFDAAEKLFCMKMENRNIRPFESLSLLKNMNIDVCYLSPSLGKYEGSCTDAQLTFMQGLSAPLVVHNLYGPGSKMDFAAFNMIRENMARLSGERRDESLVKYKQESLKKWWGITNREGALKQIKDLLSSGQILGADYAAWDYSRVVWVAQTCFAAGYISAEEVVTYGMEAARRSKELYGSWTEFGEVYLKGYLSFCNGDVNNEMYQERAKITNFVYRKNFYLGTSWNVSFN